MTDPVGRNECPNPDYDYSVVETKRKRFGADDVCQRAREYLNPGVFSGLASGPTYDLVRDLLAEVERQGASLDWVRKLPDNTGLTLWLDERHWFPFIEDERLNITGPGHQDPAVFAAAVTAYDRLHNPEAVATDPGGVEHAWIAAEDEEGQPFTVVAEDAEGAVPVTTLWGVR